MYKENIINPSLGRESENNGNLYHPSLRTNYSKNGNLMSLVAEEITTYR